VVAISRDDEQTVKCELGRHDDSTLLSARAHAAALHRGCAVTSSRSLVTFTAIRGDHLRRDQQPPCRSGIDRRGFVEAIARCQREAAVGDRERMGSVAATVIN
jgi:hypothetical protein